MRTLWVAGTAVHGTRISEIGWKRESLDRVQYRLIVTRSLAVSRGCRTVDLCAGVVDHVHTRAPEPRRVRFDHVPVERGEGFVEVRVAVYVGKQRIGEPAVPHADPRWHLTHARLTRILDAVPVQIHVGLRPEVLLPGERAVLHIERLAVLYGDRSA